MLSYLQPKRYRFLQAKGFNWTFLSVHPSTVLNELLRDSWPLHILVKVKYTKWYQSDRTCDQSLDISLLNLFLFLPKYGGEPFWPVFLHRPTERSGGWESTENHCLYPMTRVLVAKEPVEMSSLQQEAKVSNFSPTSNCRIKTQFIAHIEMYYCKHYSDNFDWEIMVWVKFHSI